MMLIRAFIAIRLTPELRDTLQRAQDALCASAGGPAGRFVSPENVHVTLKFLGEVTEAQLPAICAAVTTVVAGYEPLALELGALGCFPHVRRPRVVWVGLAAGAEQLTRLATELDVALHALGFARETRPFAAHLTLARINERADSRQAAALAQAALALGPLAGAMVAKEVAVIKSELRPQGPRYTALCVGPLGTLKAR